LSLFPDCKGTEADLWHNLLTKHRVYNSFSGSKASDLDGNTDFSVHACSSVCGSCYIVSHGGM